MNPICLSKATEIRFGGRDSTFFGVQKREHFSNQCVAFGLGHSSIQTTEMYVRADPTVKLEALESVVAPKLRIGTLQSNRQTDRIVAGGLFYAERKNTDMT